MDRIVLFLMSLKGLKVLNTVIEEFGSDIIEFVVLNKDENVQKDYYQELKLLSESNVIQTFHRGDSFKITTKYVMAISWRWLIDLSKTDTKLIVLHDSLLPKYRGFAPLVTQLIEGETDIGVTAFFANNKFDAGAIIGQKQNRVTYPIKIQDAIELISELYLALVIEIIKEIILNNSLIGFPQKDDEATYSLWRNEEDYRIDWTWDSSRIGRFVDAVGYPYKGALTYLSNRAVRIFDTVEIKDVNIINRDLGKVIFYEDNDPVVVCGKGLLKIKSAIYDDGKSSILPLKKYRIKFT